MLVVSILTVLIVLILILLIVGGSAGRKETRRLEKKNREALKNAKREAKNKNRYEDILKQQEVNKEELQEIPAKEPKHLELDPLEPKHLEAEVQTQASKMETEPETQITTDLDADIQFLFDEDPNLEEVKEVQEEQVEEPEEIEEKEEKQEEELQEIEKDPMEQLEEEIDTVILPEEPEIDRKALDELIDKYIREAKEKANDIGYLNGDGPEEVKEEKDPLVILKEQEKEEQEEAEKIELEEGIEEIDLGQEKLETEEIKLEQDETEETELGQQELGTEDLEKEQDEILEEIEKEEEKKEEP